MHKKIRIIFSIFVVVISWEIIIRLKLVSPLLFPSPSDVWIAVVHIFLSFSGLTNIGYTLMRCVGGLLIGVVVGVLSGLILSSSERVGAILMPWVDFVRSIPAPAFIPLFLLLFGIGEQAKIILIVLVVGLLIAVSMFVSIQNISPTRRMVAKSVGLTKKEILFLVLLPEILPQLSAGFRLAISFSLILTNISEMSIGTQHGIGRAMLNAQLLYETPTMYAYIIISGIIGYYLNMLYLRVEKRYIHWMGK